MEDIPDDNPLSLGRLPLERRLKRVQEGMTEEEPLSAEESEVPVIAVFTCDAGKKTASPRIRDTRVLEWPKSINPSRSCIHQPKRFNTCDSGTFLLFFLNRI